MRSVRKLVPRANRGGSGQLPGEKPGSDARGERPSDPGAPQIVVTLVYLDEAYEERVREGARRQLTTCMKPAWRARFSEWVEENEGRFHWRRRNETDYRADDLRHGEFNDSDTLDSCALCSLA